MTLWAVIFTALGLYSLWEPTYWGAVFCFVLAIRNHLTVDNWIVDNGHKDKGIAFDFVVGILCLIYLINS